MFKTLSVLLFLVLFLATPAAASEKGVILQMTTTLENSDTQLHFNYAENLGDGRGITFGCIGFCTGTYDGNILIHHYQELNPDNTLVKYIPALDTIDAGRHNAAGGDGNPSTAGLDGFIRDVQNCDDPLFRKAQIDKLDELYYNPAMKLANEAGCQYSLTRAFIYDMCVRHGPDGAKSIIKQAGTTPKQGADEKVFLQKMFTIRDAKLKQEGLGDVNRDQGFKNVLNSGNVNLQTPFKFVAYGETFTIDGNLDLGEYQEETPVEEPEEPEVIEPEEPVVTPEDPVITPTEPEDKDKKDWDKHHKKHDNRRHDRHDDHRKHNKNDRCK